MRKTASTPPWAGCWIARTTRGPKCGKANACPMCCSAATMRRLRSGGMRKACTLLARIDRICLNSLQPCHQQARKKAGKRLFVHETGHLLGGLFVRCLLRFSQEKVAFFRRAEPSRAAFFPDKAKQSPQCSKLWRCLRINRSNSCWIRNTGSNRIQNRIRTFCFLTCTTSFLSR